MTDWLDGPGEAKQVAEGPAQVGAVAGRQAQEQRQLVWQTTHTQRERKTLAWWRSRNAVSDREPSASQADGLTEKPRSKRTTTRTTTTTRTSGWTQWHESRQCNGRYWKEAHHTEQVSISKVTKNASEASKNGLPNGLESAARRSTRPSQLQGSDGTGGDRQTGRQTDRRRRVFWCHVNNSWKP